MHNLYLGTSKMVIHKVWIESNVLSPAKIAVINRRLKRVHVPIDIGHCPVNVRSGATFTAEQWTMYFSVNCLFELLSTREMECWRHFVLACRRLYKRHLTAEDIHSCSRMCLSSCHPKHAHAYSLGFLC